MTDTSELYVQMCEQATEIQEGHEWKEGECLSCADGIDYVGGICAENGAIKGGSCDYDFIVNEPFIFLPDMRWLIEQIGCPVTLIIQKEKTFISSDGFNGHWHGKTPEQALLNAYMIIKHNKVWSTPDSRWELCC